MATFRCLEKREDDNMKPMIASGQVENLVTQIVSAARKGTEEAISKLVGNGVLTPSNFQRVLAQGDKVGMAVKPALLTALAELAENVIGRLKRIFVDKTIELDVHNGNETIAEATDTFRAEIYGAKKRNTRCKPTPKTLTAVYEMIKDGTYQQIFGGFGENLERLCWQESQIVAFCRDHRDLLRTDGYATFFLFQEEDGSFSVARVHVDEHELDVSVRPLGYGLLWSARYRHRVVVLQL